MSIPDMGAKCKAGLAWARAQAARVPKDALVLAVLLLASLASFGLGYLTGRDAGVGEQGISIEVTPAAAEAPEGTVAAPLTAATGQGGAYVASKNGSKYYLTSCAAANRISDKNKVWFTSAAAAVAAGYAPAANCPGL